MISKDVANLIESSVLCWLATVSAEGVPNVSPKEAFLLHRDGRILVANIASPGTVRNIRDCPKVCVSFVNVFLQRGYKIVGEARILTGGEDGYDDAYRELTDLVGGTFPILSIIEIVPAGVEPILAPSYRLFPDSTEQDRIRESLESYRVAEYEAQVSEGRDG